jgi:ankyrin repeat protein
MLDLGFPVDVAEHHHGYLPLHNAAWCGDPALVQLLLERGHPVDRRDPTYRATALGFALHSCLVARRHPDGDFPRVVSLLLAAGVPLDAHQYPTGQPALDAVISQHRK